MKINTNVPALNAYTATSRTQAEIAKSSKRLSTGLKISSVSDDAAGRAISNKLRIQVRGLGAASQNSSNAVSAIQTAEGALNEVHSMLQRINELCVAAANGTNTPEDVQKMQLEIDQLKDEINSTSLKTDFNRTKLLNGGADRITYSSTANILKVSDNMANTTYRFELTQKATVSVFYSAAAPAGNDLTDIVTGEGLKGNLFINGVIVQFDGTDTIATAYEKIRTAAEASGLVVDKSSNPEQVFSVITASQYGSEYPIEITCDNMQLYDALGFSGTNVIGKDAVIKLHNTVYPQTAPPVPVPNPNAPLSENVTYTASGNRITIRDTGGGLIVADIRADLPLSSAAGGGIYDLMTLKEGSLYVQIGANKGDEMQVKIPRINTSTLEIDILNVGAPELAQKAIDLVGNAINYVSLVRANLGAYQNRLEFTISNLDNNQSNTTQALSRIVDADMAAEMVEYSKNNVLLQAGIAVMAQANQRPQAVLQLIR